MSLLQAFSGVLVLFCLMTLGFILSRTGFLPVSAEGPLSRLTLWIAIPCTLFLNCVRFMDMETLASVGWLLLLPPASMLAGWGLSLVCARLFRIPPDKRGVFCVMFGLSNAIFIGLPLCQSFFGEASLPYVTMYFPANTLIFWTVGTAALAADGRVRGGTAKPTTADISPAARVLTAFRRVLTPPLLAAVLGTVFALNGWRLPSFLDSAVGYAGGLTVPLSLLLTGATLAHMGKDVFRLHKTGALTLLGRFVLLPGLTLGLCLLARAAGLMDLPDGALILSVFTIEAAMPVMNQAVIMAQVYHADHRLAAQMLALTSGLALLLLPLWVWGLSYV